MRAQNIVVAALTATLVSVASAPAFAQGCILIRQTSPLFGTTGALDQEVGTWTITFSGRASVANKHYNGTERQYQREIEQTYVVNRQNSITTTVSYQATPRVSLNVGIPFIEVHLSNVHAREDFRQHSYLSDVARGVVTGLGARGYEYALTYAMDALEE